MEANTTYSVEGLILAAASSTAPDLVIAFSIPSGSTMDMTYIGAIGASVESELLQTSGGSSSRIVLNTMPKVIHVKGTIKTGSTIGSTQLKWAQNTSSASATSILKGSYLRAEAF